jgi:hypothetical protein
MHDAHDAYDPHHPEFAGEGGQKLPGGGRMFGRLWFGAGGCPRAELFVVLLTARSASSGANSTR